MPEYWPVPKQYKRDVSQVPVSNYFNFINRANKCHVRQSTATPPDLEQLTPGAFFWIANSWPHFCVTCSRVVDT